MATRKYEGKKFKNNQEVKIIDSLTIEEALQINVNNKPFTVSMRTPGDDLELVRGLLHSEDIINDPTFICEFEIITENDVTTTLNVSVPKEKLGNGYNNSRSLLSVSSCGICGKTELNDLQFPKEKMKGKNQLDIALIPNLFNKMRNNQHDFEQSGGTHAAAAFSIKGEMLCTMEDIGRHNAVDKIIGKLIYLGKLKEAKIITVSGRISYEIVIKCFKAGVPFLAAVSAPSSLAVDYAKELGITLFGFSRGERTTCYANPQKTVSKTFEHHR